MDRNPLLSNPTAAIVIRIGIILVGLYLASVGAAQSQKCEQHPYSGLDSRLKADIVGIVPELKEPVVGFELINHRPVVALPDQVLSMGQKKVARMTVTSVRGISADDQGHLLIQTDAGIQTTEDFGTQTIGLRKAIRGRLYDSGSSLFLEVRSRGNIVQFVARRRDGQGFVIGSFKGPFAAASWNTLGLAAIVGDSIYIWQAGSRKIVRLMTDQGLRSARDVVLVGPERAMLTLKAMAVLVTPETVLVIAGMSSARCRFEGGVLYLVDGHTGLIWSLKGLDQLGTKASDRSHAIDLLKTISTPIDESSARFLEAARILGCDGARKEIANLKATDKHVP
jgi:hypothetical protein